MGGRGAALLCCPHARQKGRPVLWPVAAAPAALAAGAGAWSPAAPAAPNTCRLRCRRSSGDCMLAPPPEAEEALARDCVLMVTRFTLAASLGSVSGGRCLLFWFSKMAGKRGQGGRRGSQACHRFRVAADLSLSPKPYSQAFAGPHRPIDTLNQRPVLADRPVPARWHRASQTRRLKLWHCPGAPRGDWCTITPPTGHLLSICAAGHR